MDKKYTPKTSNYTNGLLNLLKFVTNKKHRGLFVAAYLEKTEVTSFASYFNKYKKNEFNNYKKQQALCI